MLLRLVSRLDAGMRIKIPLNPGAIFGVSEVIRRPGVVQYEVKIYRENPDYVQGINLYPDDLVEVII